MLVAARWLMDEQSEEGGWAERRGENLSPLNTAEALLALLRVKDGLPEAVDGIQRGVGFIESRQLLEGEDRGCWAREADGKLLPDVVRTGVIVEALAEASPASDRESLTLAVDWLRRIQDESSGGWGFRPDGQPEVLPTCFALAGLLASYHGDPEHAETARRGLAYIAGQVQSTGAVGDADPLQAVRTAYTAFCLQRASRCELNVHRRSEDAVIAWLDSESNRLKAIQEAEIIVQVGPDRAPTHGDYVFVVMTEALILRVMSGADAARRSSPLAVSALQSLWMARDERTGGFYGRRGTSWATARAVSALTMSRVTTVPPLRRTAPPIASHLMLGLVLLLVLATVGLSLEHDLSLFSVVMMIFVTLVALLAYGLISENDFTRLVKGLLGYKGRSVEDGSTGEDS